MQLSFKKFLFGLSWLMIITLALCLAGISLAYFDFDTGKDFLAAKQDMLNNIVWVVAFYLHLLAGAIATIAGIPLFFSKLIPFKSSTHKGLGKTYILAILLFGGPSGLYLSFFAEGGFWASIGFMLMSVIWMAPTYMAYHCAVNGRIKEHYQWVIRSYCITLSGVTLRLLTPIGATVIGFDEQTNFILSAFIPWILHVIIGEVLVKLNNKKVQQLIIGL